MTTITKCPGRDPPACTNCGSHPTLQAVSVTGLDAWRYVCPCGRNGAARLTKEAAEGVWNQLQEPTRMAIQRPTVKCLGTDHALCQRCLRHTTPEVEGCGWITARINTGGRGGCRNFMGGRDNVSAEPSK